MGSRNAGPIGLIRTWACVVLAVAMMLFFTSPGMAVDGDGSSDPGTGVVDAPTDTPVDGTTTPPVVDPLPPVVVDPLPPVVDPSPIVDVPPVGIPPVVTPPVDSPAPVTPTNPVPVDSTSLPAQQNLGGAALPIAPNTTVEPAAGFVGPGNNGATDDQSDPDPTAEATESATAAPSPTSSPKATSKATSKAKQALGKGGKSGGGTTLDAGLASDNGSPLSLQLAAIGIILGLGFFYFKSLRGRGRRGPPALGK